MFLPQQHSNGLKQSYSNPLLSTSRSRIPDTLLSTSRSTTLLQSELNDLGPSSVLSRLALLRADLRLRLAQTTMVTTLSTSTRARDTLLNILGSMPLIEELLDMIDLPEATEKPIDETTVLSAVAALVKNPSSSWSPLMHTTLSNSPLIGNRTQEQYMAAVNMSVKARKEARDCLKMARYWKNVSRTLLARSGSGEEVVSPSPSDISDTGIEKPLSTLRQQNVEALTQRRASPCSLKWKPVKSPSSSLSEKDYLQSVNEELCQDEQTLVSIDTLFTPNKTLDRPFDNENETAQVSPSIQLAVKKTTPEKSKKYNFLKREHKLPRSLSRLTKSASGRRISSLPTVSVQAKRNMYETLSSDKGSPTPQIAKKTGQTQRCGKYEDCNLVAIERPMAASSPSTKGSLSIVVKHGTQRGQEQKLPLRSVSRPESSRACSRASATRR